MSKVQKIISSDEDNDELPQIVYDPLFLVDYDYHEPIEDVNMRLRDPLDLPDYDFQESAEAVEMQLNIDERKINNALIHYDGQTLTSSKAYPTRIFINSKFKKRKFVNNVVTGEVVLPTQPVMSDFLSPSGYVCKDGDLKSFQLPSGTNILDFRIKSKHPLRERGSLRVDKFLSLNQTRKSKFSVVGKHRRTLPCADEFGDFIVDHSNCDILDSYSCGTHADAYVDGKRIRVTVPRLRDVYKTMGYRAQHCKPTVLYIPHLNNVNKFLSTEFGVSFFYSNNFEELIRAIDLGLNVLIVHRHLYTWVTNKFQQTIQVLIIVNKNSYFDLSCVRQRFIILNPYSKPLDLILKHLFIPINSKLKPHNLLLTLRVQLGADIEGLDDLALPVPS